MTRDPLDILTGGSNPQTTAVDLTNHPVVQAAIEASYKQEAQIAAAQWIVGMVSRALTLAGPFGVAASHVLTGSEIPADVLAQLQQGKPASQNAPSSGSCPLTGLLQNAVPQLLARLTKGG